MMPTMNNTPLPLLGGLTATQFFDEYWQKKPLLIRQAFPGFTGLLTPNELAGLACEEDAQSRLVMQRRGKWVLESGPFEEERFSGLPKKDWALLVQGVNHFLPEAAELLQQFSFVPTARLDDLMVSFAPDGGGVGPHFDSYDVFLLQGMGQRIWRVSSQDDRSLIDGAPLRILKNFDTQQEWLLEPGDMLYLPPHYAHWGIAVGECMTYSIGFRTPAAQELGAQFLGYLQEKLALTEMYADPDIQPQQHPAEISEQMVSKVMKMLQTMTWGREDVAQFIGTYLSEPKPHVVFAPQRLSADKFAQRAAKQGVQLALTTQMLFYQEDVFINGERHLIEPGVSAAIMELADTRRLAAHLTLSDTLLKLLHPWYQAGFLELNG